MKALAFVVPIALAAALVAGCTSERSSSTATSTTTTSTTTTSTTTAPDTTITSTSIACESIGDTEPKSSDDPLLMSSMVGLDIRAAVLPCFERVVIELQGTGDFPGWAVEYVDDPVRLGESDEFVEIVGDATLQVTMRVWMPSLEGGGYVGPIQFMPDNVLHILELRKTANHEGVFTWSIGLDEEYPFTVNVLHNPERLVIDFQIAVGS